MVNGRFCLNSFLDLYYENGVASEYSTGITVLWICVVEGTIDFTLEM